MTVNKAEDLNTRELKRTAKTRCINCGKDFEYEVTWETYSNNTSKFCNDKCEVEYKQKQIWQQIKEIIPRKYWDIETDRAELMKELYGKSAFLTSPVGTGKTVLMASLVKKYVRAGEKAKWIKYPAFIMELQNAYRKEGEETAFDIAESAAKHSGVLAIDDIGAEKITGFVRQITYYIINEREQEMSKTLITSNFSLDEIDEQIDVRISSRIAGMCECRRLKGEDRRLDK